MIRAILSLYSPNYAATLVYMLQACEYRVGPYLAWYWRTQNFAKVMQRKQLERTKAARLLLLGLTLGMLAQVLGGLTLVIYGAWFSFTGGVAFGLALILSYPVVWAHLVAIFIAAGRVLIVKPKEQKLITESGRIFKQHKGLKLAVAGSYGKTSMKELLVTVLAQGKKVAATPANKNVPVSHARFAKGLKGDEDILIIEYGEGGPGDVLNFCRVTHPTRGVITGVAPAHLDRYKTLQAAGNDIFELARYLNNKNVYVNGESSAAEPFMVKAMHRYDQNGALGWKVGKVKVGLDGLRFELTKGHKTLKLKSKLLGRHQLGPLSLAAALANQVGLSDEQVAKGIAATAPFEHRMRPYKLGGGWVIDDTYNGNIEGVRAGTALLAELPAERKWYVTPGLVDQGPETRKVHIEMGELIAAAKPDKVVLMQNSTTQFIEAGLKDAGYEGELKIETKPLEFYSNLAEFVAVGDLVMLQNDWPDNYA